jgi:hypothetical protein
MHESFDDDARGEETPMANRPPYPGTPRWVKVFGIIALVLLVVIMLLTGHGPGRHTLSGDAGDQVAASSVMEDHAPPEGSRG